jgi:hypothetical protein
MMGAGKSSPLDSTAAGIAATAALAATRITSAVPLAAPRPPHPAPGREAAHQAFHPAAIQDPALASHWALAVGGPRGRPAGDSAPAPGAATAPTFGASGASGARNDLAELAAMLARSGAPGLGLAPSAPSAAPPGGAGGLGGFSGALSPFGTPPASVQAGGYGVAGTAVAIGLGGDRWTQAMTQIGLQQQQFQQQMQLQIAATAERLASEEAQRAEAEFKKGTTELEQRLQVATQHFQNTQGVLMMEMQKLRDARGLQLEQIQHRLAAIAPYAHPGFAATLALDKPASVAGTAGAAGDKAAPPAPYRAPEPVREPAPQAPLPPLPSPMPAFSAVQLGGLAAPARPPPAAPLVEQPQPMYSAAALARAAPYTGPHAALHAPHAAATGAAMAIGAGAEPVPQYRRSRVFEGFCQHALRVSPAVVVGTDIDVLCQHLRARGKPLPPEVWEALPPSFVHDFRAPLFWLQSLLDPARTTRDASGASGEEEEDELDGVDRGSEEDDGGDEDDEGDGADDGGDEVNDDLNELIDGTASAAEDDDEEGEGMPYGDGDDADGDDDPLDPPTQPAVHAGRRHAAPPHAGGADPRAQGPPGGRSIAHPLAAAAAEERQVSHSADRAGPVSVGPDRGAAADGGSPPVTWADMSAASLGQAPPGTPIAPRPDPRVRAGRPGVRFPAAPASLVPPTPPPSSPAARQAEPPRFSRARRR